jgi:hypothetical protein
MIPISIIKIMDIALPPTKREKIAPRRERREKQREATKRLNRNGLQQAIAAEATQLNAK